MGPRVMDTPNQVSPAQQQGTVFHQYPILCGDDAPVCQTHQKNAITGAFPQLQPFAHRSQTRSNSDASNSSPTGLPRAKTENHRGKQSCALFVGPLAVIAGWLETNINNSLR